MAWLKNNYMGDHFNSPGDPRIIVALLDGRVEITHPCFNGAQLSQDPSLLVYNNNIVIDASQRHGTAIASIIIGQSHDTVAGIAPGVSLVSIPIFSAQPSGQTRPATQLDLARAINRALDAGAHLINISGGQLTEATEAGPHLQRALQSCVERDVLVVAAAGNDACDCFHLPAVVATTLVVGAMDMAGEALPFSNWGAPYRDRGLLAPGQDIPTALPEGGITHSTGTSFAAAIVSGVAALLLSQLVVAGRPPSGSQVKAALLDSAIDCEQHAAQECSRLLRGRLDPGGALRALQALDATAQDTVTPRYTLTATPGAVMLDSLDPSSLPVADEGLMPSACACDTPKTALDTAAKPAVRSAPSLAYALGQIGIDFASEAVRDSFVQRGVQNPYDPAHILAHLEQNPWAAEAITWTLQQDGTPIYVLHALGAYAAETYGRIASYLARQLDGSIDLVAVPGRVGMLATLANGQTAPYLVPEPRGLLCWETHGLMQQVAAQHGDKHASEMGNFLERVFHELRNLGSSPEERALNYVATEGIHDAAVFADAIGKGMTLESTKVSRGPAGRKDADNWNVELAFFDPGQRLTRARHVYRLTVDVSAVLPVRIGSVRHWDVF
ncbi:MAG: S8 family serine peptidase [Pseudomonas sp.]|uniref:S8 family serine peptidase n=1 Tax=Pseudomonas sp. TaxID=306 RepID=UPI0033979D5C